MALSREEIAKIAQASADEISRRLVQDPVRSEIPKDLAKDYRKELRQLPAAKLQEAYDKLIRGETTGIEILDNNPPHALSAVKEALWERGKLVEPYVADRVTAPHINEHKAVGDKMIDKYSIIGTNVIVYQAWEPSGVFGAHSTITTIDGKWYGRIGTRWLPPYLENMLAGSLERIQTVSKWLKDQYEEAYKLILQVYPEASSGMRTMGEIEAYWKPE